MKKLVIGLIATSLSVGAVAGLIDAFDTIAALKGASAPIQFVDDVKNKMDGWTTVTVDNKYTAVSIVVEKLRAHPNDIRAIVPDIKEDPTIGPIMEDQLLNLLKLVAIDWVQEGKANELDSVTNKWDELAAEIESGE